MGIVNVSVNPEEAAKAAAGGGSRTMDNGSYVLRVSMDEPKVEAAKKKDAYPNLILKCEVLQSPQGRHLGQTVTRRFNLHPNSVPYNLLPFLRAAGVPYQEGPGGIQFDTSALRGVTTKVVLTVKPGEQRPLENWDNDEPYGNGGQAAPQGFPGQQFGAPQGAPMQPGFQPTPQQGFAPSPAFGQAPMQQPMQPQPGFAPPGQQMPQQGWAPPGAPQQAPQGWPPQSAPAQQPGFPQGAAQTPPWLTPGGTPRGNGVTG